MGEGIRGIEPGRNFQFLGGAGVVLLAEEHEGEVEPDRRILRAEIASSSELILGLLEVASFEVGQAEVVTEFGIAGEMRDRLLAGRDGILPTAGIDVLQQLVANLSGRLRGCRQPTDNNNKDGEAIRCRGGFGRPICHSS